MGWPAEPGAPGWQRADRLKMFLTNGQFLRYTSHCQTSPLAKLAKPRMEDDP